MTSKLLLDLLNKAIARELQVIVQYMWQHVLWSGPEHFAVKGELEDISKEEMKHAESIAERLYYLGGRPTTKPDPIFVGKTLKEMIKQDAQDELVAITLYKKIIKAALREDDETTAELFRKILSEEENHHDTFISLLEGL